MTCEYNINNDILINHKTIRAKSYRYRPAAQVLLQRYVPPFSLPTKTITPSEARKR